MWNLRFHAFSAFWIPFLWLLKPALPLFVTPSSTNSCITAPTIAPIAVCHSTLPITLNNAGTRNMVAVQLNNGSTDPAGGFLWFKARRANPGPCNSDTLFRSQLTFCCSDAGDTVEVILRVYNIAVDTGGIAPGYGLNNSADCVTKIIVGEQITPQIIPLPTATMSCEAYINGEFVLPQATDNCCLDTITYTDQYITYDTACKRGIVNRKFTARDCAGNTASSTQEILVQNHQYYGVVFPADAVLNGCSDLSPAAQGRPVVTDAACERMNVTFLDSVSYQHSGTGPCILIRRTWKVFNWCAYSASLPLQYIPNPAPVADPVNAMNWPGPVVGPAGTSTIIKIGSTDSTETDFSTFWSAAANGYKYTQLIWIYDDEAPKGRNSSIDFFCDQTGNDPNLWQGGNWQSNYASSNDLPEGVTDLSIRVIDNCSNQYLAVRYELFLDINGDNQEETRIRSSELQLPGSILYNNLFPTQEEQRQFDRRITSISNKYLFALQLQSVGDSLTARVRWNSMAEPNTFTTPQIPYGNHRVVWFVRDSCGNETSITHTFIAANDCIPPEITCVPELEVALNGPDENISITGPNLVYDVSDNVTNDDLLQYSVIKQPFTSTFPTDSSGAAFGSIEFGCSETGLRLVQVWVRDHFGNATACETLISVQDPQDNCPSIQPSITGTATTLLQIPITAEFNLFSMPDTVLEGSISNRPWGMYFFNDLTPLGNYFVRPEIDSADFLNGVNTFDLILISRHILNLEPLNTPYKIIAGDVNRSGTVTTFDIVTARKAILGSITEFPGNISWRFVPKSHTFINPANPFQNTLPEQINLSSIYESVENADFWAIKTGDVDQSAFPEVGNSIDDRNLTTGLALVYERDPNHQSRWLLYALPKEPLAGFQAAIHWPEIAENATFTSELIDEDHYQISANGISISWEHTLLAGQKQLLGAFQFEQNQDNPILYVANTATLHTEAYTLSGRPTGIEISSDSDPDRLETRLHITPNPVKNTATLWFTTNILSDARLRIFDINGHIIFEEEHINKKNQNYLPLHTTDWPSGVYICVLETENGAHTVKFIK